MDYFYRHGVAKHRCQSIPFPMVGLVAFALVVSACSNTTESSTSVTPDHAVHSASEEDPCNTCGGRKGPDYRLAELNEALATIHFADTQPGFPKQIPAIPSSGIYSLTIAHGTRSQTRHSGRLSFSELPKVLTDALPFWQDLTSILHGEKVPGWTIHHGNHLLIAIKGTIAAPLDAAAIRTTAFNHAGDFVFFQWTWNDDGRPVMLSLNAARWEADPGESWQVERLSIAFDHNLPQPEIFP